MSKPPLIKRKYSSGGVIFRRSERGIEVVLVYVASRRAWCMPKGVIEKDEDTQITALREVREETGLNGEIIGDIGKTSYWYFLDNRTVRIYKTVYYFLMRFISGSTEDHDHEVDDSRWFPVDEALEKLHYKGERDLMKKAKEMIEKDY